MKLARCQCLSGDLIVIAIQLLVLIISVCKQALFWKQDRSPNKGALLSVALPPYSRLSLGPYSCIAMPWAQDRNVPE